MHRFAVIARHIAVSEALERWAYFETHASVKRAHFGFDIDKSSNGMAAFPGFSCSPARKAARYEAIERFCLLNWWEGAMDGVRRDTRWPGIRAISFTPILGGVAVILYMKSRWGFHSYGHAAAGTFDQACQHARVELARHESAIQKWIESGNPNPPGDLFERRAWFFSTENGRGLFDARLELKAAHVEPKPSVACDSEIRGPWSKYASVWRFLLRPPSERFLHDNDQYFFW